MSDNFHFDLTGVPLDTCLSIAFGRSHKAVGWFVQEPGDGPVCRSYQAVQNALVKAELVVAPEEKASDKYRLPTGEPTALGRLATNVTSHLRNDGWELRPIARRDPSVSRMILFWTDSLAKEVMQKLPAPMSAEDAIPFVKSWLSAADYGNEPDHDGDNGKGWRVYNEGWGHVNNWWSAFVAIEPVWLMYGK